MDKEVKVLEQKAKKLIGKQVEITYRRIPNQFMEGIYFSAHKLTAKLERVDHCVLFLKKPSGMIKSMEIKDKYFSIEEIELSLK